MSGAAACVAAARLVTTLCHVNLKKKGRIFSAPTGSPPLPPPHALPSQHPSVASHRLHQTFNPNSIRPSAFPLLLPPSFPSLRYIPSLFLSIHSHLPNLASLHPCISIPRNCPGRDWSDLPGSSSDSLVMFSISPPPRLMIRPQTENSDHRSPRNTSVVSAHVWNL